MIKTKLKNLYSTLTKSEKKIADYILSEDIDLEKITSYDLAKITHVSQPTVIRFSQKLEFSSFNNMVKGLSVDTLQNNQIRANDSPQIANSKIASQYIEIINLVSEMNPTSEIEHISKMILNAKTRIAFGIGNSSFIANVMANKLNKIGLPCIPMLDAKLQMNNIYNLGKDDVLICVSQSGESIDVIKAAGLAKDQGALVISLTKFGKNKLSSLSSAVLKTAGNASNFEYCADTIKIAQLFVCDMLYINLIKNEYKNFDGPPALHKK